MLTAETAEPIEIAILILAIAALLVSAWLAHEAFQVMVVVQAGSAIMREISWLRFQNEAISVGIASLIVWVGWLQATSAAPLVPSVTRMPSLLILAAIAALSLLRSLVTAVSGQQIVRMIEREGSGS